LVVAASLKSTTKLNTSREDNKFTCNIISRYVCTSSLCPKSKFIIYPIKSVIADRIDNIIVIVGSFEELQMFFVRSTLLKVPLIAESAINKISKDVQIKYDQYVIAILFLNRYAITKRIRRRPKTDRTIQPAHTGNNPIEDKSTLGKLTVSTVD